MACKTRIFATAALLAACVGATGADPKNETVTLVSGDYTMDVGVNLKLTPRRIVHNGFELSRPTGYSGTVMAPESGKFIGSGHTEGGEEKVLESSLTVDGEKKEIKGGAEFTGQKITLEKTSMLDKLKLKVALELTPDGIVERKSYEAVEDQPISLFYLYLHCFTHATTDWAAELEDGKTVARVFKNDRGWCLEKDVKWAAQFDSAAKRGFTLSFPKVIKGKVRKSAFWDIPNAYHKYYLMLDTPAVIKKGFKSEETTMTVRGFQAEPENWAETAKKNAVSCEARPQPKAAEAKNAKPVDIPKLGDTSGEDWLVNRRGVEALSDDFVLSPFTPVKASDDGKAEVWGRKYSLDKFGLLSQADVLGKPFFKNPMSFDLVINGKKASFKPTGTKLVKSAKGRAEYMSFAEGEDAYIETRTTIEYDGMVKVDLTIRPKGSVEVGKFDYTIHYPEENARFIHYIGAPDKFMSQMVSKNSNAFGLPEKTQGTLWADPFKTLVWLGNFDKGFLWFCASERDWSPQERKERPKAVRVERKDGEVRLVVSPVTKAKIVSVPTTYTFGMFATPVRPEPKGWRAWTLIPSNQMRAQFEKPGEKVGKMLYAGSEQWLVGFYQRLKDPKAFRELADAAHKDDRLLMPYIDPIEMSMGRVKAGVDSKPGMNLNDLQTVEGGTFDPSQFAWQPPEIKFMKEWMTLPNMLLGYNMDKGDRQFRVSTASRWNDFLCFIAEKMAENGADGFGDIDNCYPTFDMNAAHGMGYTDENGVRRPEYDWFGRRDLIKRLAATFLKVRGKPPVFFAHSSATWSIPFISFCDVNITLEHSNTAYCGDAFMCPKYEKNFVKIQESLKNGARDFLYWAFPMDRWQAECLGRQFGLPAMILPNLMKGKHYDPEYAKSEAGARDLNCMMVIHDNLFWGHWLNPKPLLDSFKIRLAFGIGDDSVEFLPYWGERRVVSCPEKEVYASSYKNKGRFLVNISNTGLEDKVCKVSFSPDFFKGGKPSKVVDAETNEEVKVDNGVATLPIKRRDYKILLAE